MAAPTRLTDREISLQELGGLRSTIRMAEFLRTELIRLRGASDTTGTDYDEAVGTTAFLLEMLRSEETHLTAELRR